MKSVVLTWFESIRYFLILGRYGIKKWFIRISFSIR